MPKNRSVLAAMSGTTDSSFAYSCLDKGAGKVAIGGYPIGSEMVQSCYQMIQRGRKEFVLSIGEEPDEIFAKIQPFQRNSDLVSLMINLRFNNSTHAQHFVREFSQLLAARPIIEINAHCRQPEVTNKGGGQALLRRKKVLWEIINAFQTKSFPVSLKFRGNAISAKEFLPTVNQLPLDFLHIDSYRIGEVGTDLDLLSCYSRATSIPIIGNNSIIDRTSAEAVLDAGAEFFSLARAAERNPSIFRSLKNI